SDRDGRVLVRGGGRGADLRERAAIHGPLDVEFRERLDRDAPGQIDLGGGNEVGGKARRAVEARRGLDDGAVGGEDAVIFGADAVGVDHRRAGGGVGEGGGEEAAGDLDERRVAGALAFDAVAGDRAGGRGPAQHDLVG